MENPLIDKIKKICKDEEIIILFDSEERVDWGIPEVLENGILMKSENGETVDGYKSWFYPWDDISLVAHYGFQVKKIKDELTDFRKIKVFQLNKNKIQLCEHDWELAVRNVYDKTVDKCFLCGFEKLHRDEDGIYKPMYFGDPLEIYGQFSILGNGLYVQQEYGAEGVIMPNTEMHLAY